MNRQQLNEIIDIIKNLENVEYSNGTLSGEYLITKENISFLQLLSEPAFKNNGVPILEDKYIIDNKEIYIDDLIKQNLFPKRAKIFLFPHHIPGLLFIENLNLFLKKLFNSKIKKPFFILELNYYSDSGEQVLEIKNAYQLLELVNILKRLSDYFDESNNKLIFIQNNKCELPINLTTEGLKNINDLSFINKITKQNDAESRIVIFKSTLIDFLKNVDEKEKFQHLVAHFNAFKELYENNYNIYLSKFSFEKIKSEFEKSKVEYIQKINQVITEVQNKIIAIPLGFLLLFGQLNFYAGLNLKNILLIMSAIIFSIILHLLISNQYNSLNDLKNEIDNYSNKLSSQYPNIYSNFKDDFENLNSRIKSQKKKINIFKIIIWLIPVISILTFAIIEYNQIFYIKKDILTNLF